MMDKQRKIILKWSVRGQCEMLFVFEELQVGTSRGNQVQIANFTFGLI